MCLLISPRSASQPAARTALQAGLRLCLCTRTREEQSPLEATLSCPHSHTFGYCISILLFYYYYFLRFVVVWVAELPCGLGKQEARRSVVVQSQGKPGGGCAARSLAFGARLSCSKAVCSPGGWRVVEGVCRCLSCSVGH